MLAGGLGGWAMLAEQLGHAGWGPGSCWLRGWVMLAETCPNSQVSSAGAATLGGRTFCTCSMHQCRS
eukprot:363941-Chlamydomonas_euryale.AAC.8